MLEFIRENYTLLNDSPLLIAAIVGVFCYKKYKYTEVKYFIFFLIYVFFVDFLGGYPKFISDYEFLGGLKTLIKGTVFEQNYWWFTLFWSVGSILFITFYYQKVLKNKRNIAVVKYMGILFGIISISYIIFNWNVYFISGFPFIYLLGACVVFLSVALYFVELLNGDIILTFYKSINFYISVALLIWWLVTTPVVFFDIYLSKVDMKYAITKAIILLSSNIFMYLTFAFALVWCKSEENVLNTKTN